MSGVGVPSEIWSRTDDQTIQLEVGCAMCAFENVDAPVKRIYMWAGVIYCLKHLLALRDKK